MRNLDKYKGVIPAFYACYDEKGEISPAGVQRLAQYFIDKGVKGVYVNGSSGECIYQSNEGSQGQADSYCPCSLQQYQGQHGAGCSC